MEARSQRICLLLHAWAPLTHVFFSFNAVSCSISVELAFYATFPILIVRFNRNWGWKLLGSFGLLAFLIFVRTELRVPDPRWNYDGVTL